MRRTRRPPSTAIAAAAAMVAVATAATLASFAGTGASHVPGGGTIKTLAVDMDVTGNSIDEPVNDSERATLGPIDSCRQISAGETATIDIVVQGYPADHPLVGYGISLIYDPAIVKVVDGLGTFDGSAGNALPAIRTLISADPQSGPLVPFTDTRPDTDGYFFMNVGDIAPRQAQFDPGGLDESVDGQENVDGFLARITLEAVGPGTSDLTLGPGTGLKKTSVFANADLANPITNDDSIPIDNLNADVFTGAITNPPAGAESAPDGILDSIQGAAISVDEPCVAPDTTPPPGAKSPWTPSGTPTESAAATATAIAAQNSPQATPSATTPKGPPASGGAPGQGQGDGDGGLGSAGWAAIGGGLGAAALGAATWYVIRRRSHT